MAKLRPLDVMDVVYQALERKSAFQNRFQVSSDNDNKDGEIMLTFGSGDERQEFVIRSQDIRESTE
jgi:hypothetical protein